MGHGTSVRATDGPKSGHKDATSICDPDSDLGRLDRLRRYEPSEHPRTERLRVHDENERGILASYLAKDECFLDKIERVAAVRECRVDAAYAEAASYGPYRGPKQAYIARLMMLGARQPDRVSRLQAVANAPHTRAAWYEAPLESVNAQRARDRFETLVQGAEMLARRGAGKCMDLRCETPLRRAEKDKRRGRREYCELHDEKRSDALKRSDREMIRAVLEAAVGSRTARRERRRTKALTA